jgi:hypothetical protein
MGDRTALHGTAPVRLVPACVAPRERRRRETVKGHGEAYGGVGREQNRVGVRRLRFLQDENGEDDRGQAARTEPAHEADGLRSRMASRQRHRYRDEPDHREAEDTA